MPQDGLLITRRRDSATTLAYVIDAMKFHTHPSMYERFLYNAERDDKERLSTWPVFYAHAIANLSRLPRGAAISSNSRRISCINAHENITIRARIDAEWYRLVRPYYKVFPAFVPILSRFSLNTNTAALQFTKRTFCIRFPVGSELTLGRMRCTSILTAVQMARDSESGDDIPWLFVVPIVYEHNHQETKWGYSWDGSNVVGFKLGSDCNGETLHDGVMSLSAMYGDDPASDESGILRLIISTAITTHLLADDTSIIHPDVLASDRQAFDSSLSGDARCRLVAKAKRRGIVGYRLGEQHDSIPHFRRPHLALVWTGKGRVTPKIVQRKGSVVHRATATTIPTGYIREDGTELEMANI